MRVNLEPRKTCAVVFRPVGQVQPGVNLVFQGRSVPVQDYTYLAVAFHATHGPRGAPADLAASGTRAMHAMLGRLRACGVSQFDLRARVFDALVEPVLSRAAHAWGPTLFRACLHQRAGAAGAAYLTSTQTWRGPGAADAVQAGAADPPPAWPRRFQLERITRACPRLLQPADTGRVAVVQSLADHDPDVDAIYRILRSVPFGVDARSSTRTVVLPACVCAPWRRPGALHRQSCVCGHVHSAAMDAWTHTVLGSGGHARLHGQ
jgi:hypothetical protein